MIVLEKKKKEGKKVRVNGECGGKKGKEISGARKKEKKAGEMQRKKVKGKDSGKKGMEKRDRNFLAHPIMKG